MVCIFFRFKPRIVLREIYRIFFVHTSQRKNAPKGVRFCVGGTLLLRIGTARRRCSENRVAPPLKRNEGRILGWHPS